MIKRFTALSLKAFPKEIVNAHRYCTSLIWYNIQHS